MRHIVARGGGGLSLDPGNLALDRRILELSGRPCPRVCYLPTAGGDDRDGIIGFYVEYTTLDCQPTHLTLFRRGVVDLESYLREQDVIWVGGGNTRNMLALWREWDLPRILAEAAAAGTVLAGSSAGAICWFAQGLTDSIPGQVNAMPCLGFLEGTCCPHYDSEPLRRPRFRELLERGEVGGGIALDDGAAAHYVDGELTDIWGWKPEARAFRLALVDGAADETPLAVTSLI